MFTPPRTFSFSKHIKTASWLLSFLWSKDGYMRLGIAASLLLMIVTIACNSGIPLLFKLSIDTLSEPHQTDFFAINLVLIGYAAAWIFSQVLSQLSIFCAMYTLENGLLLLSKKVFKHIHTLSSRFHAEGSTGNITSAIDRAQTGFESFFWGFFLTLLPTLLEMVTVTSIFIYFYSPAYGIIFLITTVVYVAFSSVGISMIDATQSAYNHKKSESTSLFVDSLLNRETVKYFSTQDRECDQYSKRADKQASLGINISAQSALLQTGQKIILGSALAFITWKSGNAVFLGAMHISDFVLIHGYIMRIATALNGIGYTMQHIGKGLSQLHDISNLLKTAPEIQDAPNAHTLHTNSATITFSNVSFGYETARLVLNNLSFTIPARKTVAIVGPSGAGKSTITKLLFRFYDVIDGSIRFNGYDMRTIKQESLCGNIGIVSQETNLFNNTVLYNITYGYPQASPEEIECAVKDAHLDEFIKKLPKGYHTIVGERGLKLSGGEKQRLAIARLLLRKPVLYIFDEATSSLDSVTEQSIQKNLRAIGTNKTTLIIAHRLSTIAHADQILVLEEGSIKEQGTHQQLLMKNGLYTSLWNTQKQNLNTSYSPASDAPL